MKIMLILIYVSFILLTCTRNEKYDEVIKGSWYNLNIEEKTYEEIHINDSLFIYCFDNCDVIIPYQYFLLEDTIYLLSNNCNIKEKYMISYIGVGKKKLYLINKKSNLTFTKMGFIYKELNYFLSDFETLDSLTNDYFIRKNKIMKVLNDP